MERLSHGGGGSLAVATKSPSLNRRCSAEPPSPTPGSPGGIQPQSRAVAQEISAIQALKRLSIGAALTTDPDLPDAYHSYHVAQALGIDMEAEFQDAEDATPQMGRSLSASAPRATSPPQLHRQTSLDAQTPTRRRSQRKSSDRNSLLWVPASVHPELAPQEWKTFVENKVADLDDEETAARRLSNSSLSSLSRSPSATYTHTDVGEAHVESKRKSGLQRSNSRLSKQIRDQEDYTDGSEILENRRRSSLLSTTTLGSVTIEELSTQLSQLATNQANADPFQLARSLSVSLDGQTSPQKLQRRKTQDGQPVVDSIQEEEESSLPSLGLRRAKRTNYSKPSSIRRARAESAARERPELSPFDVSDSAPVEKSPLPPTPPPKEDRYLLQEKPPIMGSLENALDKPVPSLPPPQDDNEPEVDTDKPVPPIPDEAPIIIDDDAVSPTDATSPISPVAPTQSGPAVSGHVVPEEKAIPAALDKPLPDGKPPHAPQAPQPPKVPLPVVPADDDNGFSWEAGQSQNPQPVLRRPSKTDQGEPRRVQANTGPGPTPGQGPPHPPVQAPPGQPQGPREPREQGQQHGPQHGSQHGSQHGPPHGQQHGPGHHGPQGMHRQHHQQQQQHQQQQHQQQQHQGPPGSYQGPGPQGQHQHKGHKSRNPGQKGGPPGQGQHGPHYQGQHSHQGHGAPSHQGPYPPAGGHRSRSHQGPPPQGYHGPPHQSQGPPHQGQGPPPQGYQGQSGHGPPPGQRGAAPPGRNKPPSHGPQYKPGHKSSHSHSPELKSHPDFPTHNRDTSTLSDPTSKSPDLSSHSDPTVPASPPQPLHKELSYKELPINKEAPVVYRIPDEQLIGATGFTASPSMMGQTTDVLSSIPLSDQLYGARGRSNTAPSEAGYDSEGEPTTSSKTKSRSKKSTWGWLLGDKDKQDNKDGKDSKDSRDTEDEDEAAPISSNPIKRKVKSKKDAATLITSFFKKDKKGEDDGETEKRETEKSMLSPVAQTFPQTQPVVTQTPASAAAPVADHAEAPSVQSQHPLNQHMQSQGSQHQPQPIRPSQRRHRREGGQTQSQAADSAPAVGAASGPEENRQPRSRSPSQRRRIQKARNSKSPTKRRKDKSQAKSKSEHVRAELEHQGKEDKERERRDRMDVDRRVHGKDMEDTAPSNDELVEQQQQQDQPMYSPIDPAVFDLPSTYMKPNMMTVMDYETPIFYSGPAVLVPPGSGRAMVMYYHRFPLHIERAIYRLSHLKLANPRRPLVQQVLLSNFMYAYLDLINQGYQQQQQQYDPSGGPAAGTEAIEADDYFSEGTYDQIAEQNAYAAVEEEALGSAVSTSSSSSSSSNEEYWHEETT